jgi:8-oxo-dGTP pyrophosphatase MutT (NUDIX family)
MDHFARRLKSSLQRRFLHKLAAPKRAAVAAILTLSEPRSLLMIRRAEHPNDPWSGHMGFPGGRCEAGESDLEAVIRETREEIGLQLGKTQILGRLDDVQAVGHGKVLAMAIAPFVFCCSRVPETKLDAKEVQEVIWIPIDFLKNDKHLETLPFTFNNLEQQLPCYVYLERKIWGLSFRMIRELLKFLP